MSDIKEVIVNSLNDDMPAGKVRGMLVFKYDMNENEARKAVSQVLEEMGMSTEGKRTNWEAVVSTIRENHGSVSTKVLAEMIVENAGTTLSTAKHYISAVAFAKEWARQENDQ